MAQPFGAPPPAGPASPAKGRQTEPAQEPVELRAADVVAVKSLDPVDAQVRGLSGAEAASPRMAREYPAWGCVGSFTRVRCGCTPACPGLVPACGRTRK